MLYFFAKKKNKKTKAERISVKDGRGKEVVCRNVVVGKRKNKFICKEDDTSFLSKIIAIAGLFFLGGVVYIFLFSEMLQVQTMKIDEPDDSISNDVQAVVKFEMERKKWGIFRGSNLVFLDVSEIEKNILDRCPKVRKAEIRRKFPNTIEILLENRIPVLVYCQENNCFVLDEKGELFFQADFERNVLGEGGLGVLYDESGAGLKKHDFLIDLTFIDFLQRIVERMKEEKMPVKKDFFTPAIVSGDLRLETEAGWKVFFNKALGVETSMEILRKVLTENITLQKENELEYVDMRLSGKIYYKMKNQEAKIQDDTSLLDSEPEKEKTKKKKK